MAHFTICARVTLTNDLDLPKLGHMTGRSCLTCLPFLKFIGLSVLEIYGHKMQILWPPLLPSLPWQPVCAPLVRGSFLW